MGTLARGIQQAAREGDPMLFAALWVTVTLEIIGGVLALALVRPRARSFPQRLPALGGKEVPDPVLLVSAWGAGTLLAGHGGLFVAFGIFARDEGGSLTSEILWYSLFWGPWFMTGGLLFCAAAWSYLRSVPVGRAEGVASVLGAFGGLMAAGVPVIASDLVK